MKKNTMKNLSTLFVCLVSGLVLFVTGCTPSDNGNNTNDNTNVNNTNGNSNNNTSVVKPPLKCEKGTLCIIVGSDGARACDILLKNKSNIANPQVNFASGAVGQFKHRDSRIALSLITQKDERLGPQTNAALVKVDGGVDGLALDKATCYDRKGAPIKDAAVQILKP